MRLYTLNPESKGINLSTLLYFDVVESRCCKAQTKLNASFTDFKKFSKSRELNFVTILVLLGIMAFQYISPNQSQSVLTQYAQKTTRYKRHNKYQYNRFACLVCIALCCDTILSKCYQYRKAIQLHPPTRKRADKNLYR